MDKLFVSPLGPNEINGFLCSSDIKLTKVSSY